MYGCLGATRVLPGIIRLFSGSSLLLWVYAMFRSHGYLSILEKCLLWP